MSEADDFLALVAGAQLRSAEGEWAEAAALWARVTAANPVNGDYWARLDRAARRGSRPAAPAAPAAP